MSEDDQLVLTAVHCHADADIVQRVLDRLPAMSTGYERIMRPELLRALACFADLPARAHPQLAGRLTTLGWTSQDVHELTQALDRVHTHPCTPEEWVVHDAYVVETGHGSCLTPWGVHLQAHPGSPPPPQQGGQSPYGRPPQQGGQPNPYDEQGR